MRKAIFLASLSVMMASVLGMPADKVGEDGNTRLMAAIVNEDDNGIRSCYNSGDVNVSCQNKDGNNAIMLALIHDNLKLAKKMLNRLSNDGIQRLLISQKNKTPLSKEQTKQTRSWSHVNDTNEEGETLLHIAARKNAMELVKILIDLGADADAKNKDRETPLEIAAMRDRFDIVDCLLGYGAMADRWIDGFFLASVLKGRFGLAHFVREGHKNIVKHQVEILKEDVNKENNLGETPLFDACKSGNENLVKYLIEHGAEVNKANQFGETPLFDACLFGKKIEVVKYLVEHGADVNKANQFGETPLFFACRSGNESLVKYLVEEHRADVNKVDSEGGTPLDLALYIVKHDDMVKYLKGKGAVEGRTFASEAGHEPDAISIADSEEYDESSGDESDDMSISEYLQELGVGAVLKDGSELSEDDL